MKFSPALIERLRSHFLVSEVVGKRIMLKKNGRSFLGLCPFHGEKSPSFHVHDEKGYYHCFGCGAHGNAIDFVRLFDHIPFTAAVELLAREAGIEITQPTPAEFRKIEAEKTLYDVLEAATVWFEKQLVSLNGIIAKDYVEGRGLRPETLRQFRIGFAPDERAGLYNHLLKIGFSQALQAEAGLINISDLGEVYDKFRGRIMFPIRNSAGKVIAFGGRLIASSSNNKHLPKYLNSPETTLFKKSEVLYNLDQAKTPARADNMVVVVEGYMDVVMTAQNGINYGVATLGTAVSNEHLRLLWKLAKEPVLCLDGDAAGKRAMLRAAEIALPLLKPSYSLRYAILPKGDDPDSYIQKHGKASFEKILFASRRLSQVLWEEMLTPHYNLDLPEGRAAIDDAYQKLAAKITDNTVRGHYLNHFRKELWAFGALQKPTKKTIGSKNGVKIVANQAKITSPEVEQRISQHHSADLEKLVEKMLNILTKCPSLLHKSHIDEVLLHLHIRSSDLKKRRDKLLAMANMETENFENAELDEAQATALWNETISAYEVANLEFEYNEMTQKMGAFNDEADFMRFLELQNNLNLARSRRTFAPAHSDVA
jgi:DNA primase